jgi:Mrp family chromosome partitioning ATPase
MAAPGQSTGRYGPDDRAVEPMDALIEHVSVREALPPPRAFGVAEGSHLVHRLRLERTGCTVLQLIAARNGEGTSTLVRDLGLIAAQAMGLRVLLLDGDAAQPKPRDQLCAQYRLPETMTAPVPDAADYQSMMRFGGTAFYVGQVRRTLALQTPVWSSTFPDLRARFDLIVVDAPALERSFDGVQMAPYVDTTAIVIAAESTRATAVKNLRDRLREAGANIGGLVLNKRSFHVPQLIYERL